ncbi:MAG: SRPBCC domain-containing protein [Chitinophagaceae bacterium]|nr:MAG: SRPBCC domain-containing protein [Chitinophagaceae bacterium]
METLDFKKQIEASRARVWEVLWGEDTYPKWTSPFCAGSVAESDWQEGSEIKFLDAKGSGMLAVIKKKVPGEYMSFVIEGMVDNGKEVREGPSVDDWKGGQENYTLLESGGGTELKVHLTSDGMDPDMLAFFKDAWPKALDKLDELATNT